MAFERPGAGGLNYQTCRYGTSKLLFRGPRRKLVPPYVLFLGGTDTYGRFVPKPFPDLVAAELSVPCINMGCANAGPDAFAEDAAVRTALARSDLAVIEIMGAHNLSNRYFRVHPRRNDRFIAAEPALTALFPEVDFTDFSFTRHMLSALEKTDAARFAQVRGALQEAWLTRMETLLGEAKAALLLWVADAPPPPRADSVLQGRDPLLVDAEMVERLARRAAGLLEVIPSAEARAAGTEGMVFSDLEATAADCVAGPAVHREIAAHLVPTIAERMAEDAA